MKLADFSSPEFFQNPYPLYEKLRAEGPLVPVGPNMMMSGHYDVVDTLMHDRRMARDIEGSVRARYGTQGFQNPVLQALRKMVFALNPPEHTRMRSLLMKAFNARQVDSMRNLADSIAHRLIDGFSGDGAADLLSAYALPFPVELISAMLGVPRERNPELAAALKQITKLFEAAPVDAEDLPNVNDAYLMLERYFGEIVEARRKQPRTDLISMLIGVQEDDERLTHDEIVANVIVLYLAGHESTSHMIGNALITLQRHPPQFEALKSNLTKLPNAILESLRYESSVHLATRVATEDMEISGVPLPRGTLVFMSLGAANRDPARFAHPDRFDIERELPRAITFGGGIHHCLGYRLAMLELEASLRVLLSRLPGLTLTGIDNLNWFPRGTLRGVEKLMARW